MKKYKICIEVSRLDNDPERFSFNYETLNGGGGFYGTRDEIDTELSLERLNELIRKEHAFNNPFEDTFDYPVVEIDDCGKHSAYVIPESEKWRIKETVQIYKTGEIVGCNQYDYEQDKEVLLECFVRFKRHNQYYVTFFSKKKGYEYLGFPDEWLEPGQIIRLEGTIISSIRFDRAENLSGETVDEKEWDIREIEGIEISCKSCKGKADTSGYVNEKCLKDECDCILPEYIVTFKDNTKIKVFGYDARLVSELTQIPLKNPSDPQLNLFAFS